MPDQRRQRVMQLTDEMEDEILRRGGRGRGDPSKFIRRIIDIYLDVPEEQWVRLVSKAKDEKVTPGKILTGMLKRMKAPKSTKT